MMYSTQFLSTIRPNTKTLLILLAVCILSLFACSGAKNIKQGSIPSFKITHSTISKEVKKVGGLSAPMYPTQSFSSNDREVISHIGFAHLTNEHQIRWEWYKPDGDLYYSTKNHAFSTQNGGYIEKGSACHTVTLKGAPAVQYPGKWNVKIYLDNSLLTTETFFINNLKEGAEPVRDIAGLDFGNYYALVIGINNYGQLEKIKSANNDARDVANILVKQYNFDVTLLLDATRSDIIMALDRMRFKLTDKDNLLIYYAGHGTLDDDADEGYWLPVDATSDSTLNWISNSNITATLKAMHAKHVLVVADSCYAGKLVRNISPSILKEKSRQEDKGYYEVVVGKKSRNVLSSGGVEPVLDGEGEEGHSVFATAFLDALNKNDGLLDGTQLFFKLRRAVMLNADQTPEYSDIRKAGHDGGDFLFVSQKIQNKKQ